MRHWQNLNDEKPQRYWLHGRGWWGRLHLEIAIPRRPRMVATLSVDVATFRTWMLCANLLGSAIYLGPGDRDSEMREYGLRFYDGCLWWRFGADTMSWSSETPKWRDCCFHVSDWIFGRAISEIESVLDEREVLIPMPEGCYPARARLELRAWKRRFRTRRTRCINIDVIDTQGGVPHDGKGDNSWDCGGDGTYGIYIHDVDSIEQGIGNFVASSLRSREKYGNRYAERDGRMVNVRWAAGVSRSST